MSDEFSVYQFFHDGSYERIVSFVSAEQATKTAYHYSHNVAAQKGITQRVIITDGGDNCNFEWVFGQGVVFPPKEQNSNE
jgi:hypothetical protein